MSDKPSNKNPNSGDRVPLTGSIATMGKSQVSSKKDMMSDPKNKIKKLSLTK